jgi:hypothetical protein
MEDLNKNLLCILLNIMDETVFYSQNSNCLEG